MRKLNLRDEWPLSKYKGSGLNVEYVIENDLEYVAMCVNDNKISLDDTAYKYFTELLFDKNKDDDHDELLGSN